MLTPLYKSGDYCCVTARKGLDVIFDTNGLISAVCDAAISVFTKSDFIHAFLITDAKSGEIVEATPHKGVAYANISKYSNCMKLFSTTNLSDTQRGLVVDAARNQVGRDSYGFLDIAYLAMYTQGITWNWLEDRVLAENKQTICSQSVVMAGLAGNVREWLCGKPHPNLVWPGNLATLALS